MAIGYILYFWVEMDDARCVRDGCGRSCVFCIRGENFADMANRYKTPCQLVFQRRQKVHLHTVITTAAGAACRFESAVMPNYLMLRAFPDHVLQER